MNLYEKGKSNIGLPQRQIINFDETKLKNVIVNTQKCLYNLKIADTDKRIQRLRVRNKELEDDLEDMNSSIKILQEEKTQEISNLKSQIVFYIIKIKEYNHQLITLEKARIDDKFTHTTMVINIDKKYKNTRYILTSQIKLLSAKTNVLEDYKSTQHVLEKKLDMISKRLINEKEQAIENLCKIEHKFRIDRERFKKKLYVCLLDLTNIFQFEVSKHIPRSIFNLLSENIGLKNQLSIFMDSTVPKTQNYILCTNAVKQYERKINDMHLWTTRSIIISKLEKSLITILHNVHKKSKVNLSKLTEFNYFTEEQYIINKDKAKILAHKCETRAKHIELLLYCEKVKLTIAENQKRWLAERLQEHLQMLYDIYLHIQTHTCYICTKNSEGKQS